ncbi:MAG: extracellular solute-binding protein [Lachnospiraceae bacterium]|nr:extracellular solute-binding protein [Lachnospiraceae bacterium]
MKKGYRMLALILFCGILGTDAVMTEQRLPQSKEKEVPEEVDENTPGWMLHADEPVTLDWYINYSWFNPQWGNNLVSQKITEETGVDIHFIKPSGNEEEKLNALIASDSLPDMITMGWWEPQWGELIENDMLYPLNELADTYDMYFWKVSDEDVLNWYRQDDGNIYCYPNSSYTPKDLQEHDNIASNETFLVRKDIYEAIGSPDMTTPEGFSAAVRKAAQMFPEIDGKPLIPIGAHEFNNLGNVSFGTYLMDFLAIPYEKDDEVYDRYTDPEYIRWLKTFRELGEEGYLKDDIFIDQRSQMEEKMAEGRYFCMIYQQTDMLAQQKTLYAKDPDSIYIAVDGPRNSAGDDYKLPTAGINGWTVTMISKNCEHPDRAIQFMDYLMSEHGQKLTYLGVEGETYDMQDGVPVLKDEVKQLLDTDRNKYDEVYGADNMYWMLQDNVMQLQWEMEKEEPFAQLEEWTYPYVCYKGQTESFLPPDSKAANEEEKISNLWSKTLPQLLLAESDEEFDAIMQNFVEERDKYGFADLNQTRTELLQQAKEKLGME